MAEANKHPEQKARDNIDSLLEQAGWKVQDLEKFNFEAGIGIALREYPTKTGSADYILVVNDKAGGVKAVGVIEAKREESGHNITLAEEQSKYYANDELKWIKNGEPPRFAYETTGIIIRFTDYKDPKPRSREVFNFHRPETLQEWLSEPASLRKRLQSIPPLNLEKLRACQANAIENLEQSFKNNKPRALIQMATGSGKTYAAVTSVYRLLKYAGAKRILFLVDTRNLGEQAEQEFNAYEQTDDNRKFIELYNVRRLTSSYIPKDSQVCISTIQRMYAILKGQSLDEAAEETNPAEKPARFKEPMPVAYNSGIPPEFFDFIIIDECHRSIYNVWRQVLDYFDAFLIGLTATPDSRAYGFFEKNVVSEYSHEKAVADGINVGHEVYTLETKITKAGSIITAGQQIEKRERLTRRKRWAHQDEDEAYSPKQLDRSIVNADQIRTIIRTFKEKLPEIFPSRQEVPKTLVFAKTDSHADDIIQTLRKEFNQGNEFCKKLTYRSEDPTSTLAQFRNNYYPRVAVTVDMIATGIDIKPLECLLFMRDVKSSIYFEQMKGRGTRTLEYDELKKATPSVKSAKTHYVIVDAVGVTKTLKTASQPLITRPSICIKELAMRVRMGEYDEDIVSTLAGRLARLNHQLDEKDQEKVTEKAGGMALTEIVGNLLSAIDLDRIEVKASELEKITGNRDLGPDHIQQEAQKQLVKEAARVFNGELIELLDTIRRDKEQTIDHVNLDTVIRAEWDGNAEENAQNLTRSFQEYLETHRDEIEALSLFYSQPARRRQITYDMIQQVMEILRRDRPKLAPLHVWRAYAQLDNYKGKNPEKKLQIVIALIRRACGIDQTLSLYSDTVHRNFESWIMKRHSGNGEKFTNEQMEWLHMIRDHIISSFHIERSDLEKSPFDRKGGMGKMYQLFGDNMDRLIDELNEALAA